MMFSMRSVPRCYKQESWSNDLVERESPASKNMSTEAEDTVGIRKPSNGWLIRSRLEKT
jgi:hypothetical protein